MRKALPSFLALTVALALGCAASGNPNPEPEAVNPPRVAALSTYSAATGTLVEVYGTDFPSRDFGRTMLVFQGTFHSSDGGTHPVDLEMEGQRIDAGTIRWDTFGPYRIPFSPTGDQSGVFEGTLSARVVTDDGTIIEGDRPLALTFEVKPSLLVHELQPVTATCGAPAQRALGGGAYRIRVEAVDFEPASFTYTLSAPAVEGFAPVSLRHAAEGRLDTAGANGDFIIPEVPEDQLSYGAILTVQALDVMGRTHSTAFAIGVHRPLEFFYNGNVQIAEILAPVPVTACIPGGEAGRNATYDEGMSETRSRGYSVNWNESWLSSHTVASSTAQTVGLSESNGVGFATTNGSEFRWNLGGEVGGSIGIDKLASLSAKTTFGIGGTTSQSATNSANREQGVNAAETTTDTESATEGAGGGVGGEFSWEVSSSESISRDFGGVVIARTYGVFYRQAMRLLRQGVLVTYNQCGAAEVVAEVDFTDWTWAVDMALADSCPPLPASNLPAAECMISPCVTD